MIRKYLTSLLLFTCFAVVCYGQTDSTGKKKRFSELPTVSDERADMSPEEYDKMVETRAKAHRAAELKRQKDLKAQRDAEKALYGDGAASQDGKSTTEANTPPAEPEPGTAVDTDDLPISQEELQAARIELEAEQARKEQARQSEEAAKIAAKAAAAKGDVTEMQKIAAEGNAKSAKDYGAVRMVNPPSAEELTKAGLPLPANASMKYNNDTTPSAAINPMDRQDVLLPRKISDSLFIFMLRTGCGLNPCSSYSMEIFFDGTVNYHGINNTELRGDYTTKVSKEVLRKFFDFAKDMKYYSLQDSYLAPDDNGKNPDKQYTYTIMQVKGKKKLVQDGHYNTPSELIFFHKLIEDSFDDVQWTPMGKKKDKKINSGNKKR